MVELKAKLIDFEQGQNEVALNEEQAKELDFNVLDRVKLSAGGKSIVAIVDHSRSLVARGEIGLFDEAAKALNAKKGQMISVELAPRPQSLDAIRKKLDGGILSDGEVNGIIADLMDEKLSNAELAAFIGGIYTKGLSTEETIALTKAIYASGGSLHFKREPVVSEHSIGGIAGDRVSMLIVPIIASLGLTIPKTATRAISSASGTADAMEVLAPVSLSVSQAERVVEKTGGCLIWGGALNIAAADDKLIKIRNPLRLDPEPLLLSSILAKKKAEGAQYVLLDIPVGQGAKVERIDKARELAQSFEALGKHMGMELQVVITEGSEPLINSIGPALEAREVLLALSGKGSESLVEKACLMAGVLLSSVKGFTRSEGYKIAKYQITSGKALEKFREIIDAQGGKPDVKPEDIRIGEFVGSFKTNEEGKVAHVDNKIISRVCRALGAPVDKKAGMVLKVSKGQRVSAGDELFELRASSKEKLALGLDVAKKLKVVEIERVILEVV